MEDVSKLRFANSQFLIGRFLLEFISPQRFRYVVEQFSAFSRCFITLALVENRKELSLLFPLVYRWTRQNSSGSEFGNVQGLLVYRYRLINRSK
ncbi:hypothetical protein QE152_g36996 [Popillia japonica]|uniref:Maturase K n=1 Tax=Popillia japonica TaxID=7064 RepID=A0AAW1IBK3_POPJA